MRTEEGGVSSRLPRHGFLRVVPARGGEACLLCLQMWWLKRTQRRVRSQGMDASAPPMERSVGVAGLAPMAASPTLTTLPLPCSLCFSASPWRAGQMCSTG